MARATVAHGVGSSGPPKYERVESPIVFAAFEARVRVLLAEYPELPARAWPSGSAERGRSPGSGSSCARCGRPTGARTRR